MALGTAERVDDELGDELSEDSAVGVEKMAEPETELLPLMLPPLPALPLAPTVVLAVMLLLPLNEAAPAVPVPAAVLERAEVPLRLDDPEAEAHPVALRHGVAVALPERVWLAEELLLPLPEALYAIAVAE